MLNLQGELDNIDQVLQSVRTTISNIDTTRDSFNHLEDLQNTYERLKEKTEVLYASLNVHHSFPELRGLDLEFVRVLLMARDLKINIRKRAIGSFFEWDKLDRAAGGRDDALGELDICCIMMLCPYLLQERSFTKALAG